MDDNEKNVSSYQLDQEILDARGISMTVEEVAGLPACKYTERIRSLKLTPEDRSFLKGLRRRIKNRLASQNSRRRSMEHLRELARELRALRVCRDYALCERDALMSERDNVREQCRELRCYVVQVLQERSDLTEVPSIDVDRVELSHDTTPKDKPKTTDTSKIITVKETKTPLLPECFAENDKNVFECRIDKLVQQSVNHLYKSDPERDKKKVYAKTVFITNDKSREGDTVNDKTMSAIEKTKKSIDISLTKISDNDVHDKMTLHDDKMFLHRTLSLDDTKMSLNKIKSLGNDKMSFNKTMSLGNDKMSFNKTMSLGNDKMSFNKTMSLGNDKMSLNKTTSSGDANLLTSDVIAHTLDAKIKKEAEELDACLKQELFERGVNDREGTVLNLSLKKEKKRSHGRKQSAPKRVAYVCMDTDVSDFVLDLKIKKENP